jgi:hypothetical protein
MTSTIIIKCKTCGQLKRHKGYSLCENCYSREGRPQSKCNSCGIVKPIKGRGLCNTCYQREGRLKLPCKGCGQSKKISGHGLCNICYRKAGYTQDQPYSKRRHIYCTECGRYRPSAALGLCMACYNKSKIELKTCLKCQEIKHMLSWQDLCKSCYNRDNTIICKVCEKEKLHYGYGMCSNCHHKLNCPTIERKQINSPRQCGRCNKIVTEGFCKGLCCNCYSYLRRNSHRPSPPDKCNDCGEVTKQYRKGLCGRCYQRERRQKQQEQPPTKTCTKCRELKHIHCKSLCESCYRKVKSQNQNLASQSSLAVM